ncbi:MAG: DUF2786 domain-containing protein [Egibacteraceae bacterium]
MGKNNRQRRAAKARERERSNRRRQGARVGDRPPPSAQSPQAGHPPRAVAELVSAAVYADHKRDTDTLDAVVSLLESAPAGQVAQELQRCLAGQVSWLWAHGWQPVDAVRLATRELGTAEVAVLRCAIALDAAGYEQLGARVAPSWMAQLQRLEASRWWDPRRPYLLQLDRPWVDTVRGTIRVLSLFGWASEIPTLMPPPGDWREGMVVSRAAGVPGAILERVRALLAKAESTTFDAEADAFTAKAQELMTRHRIDRATVRAHSRAQREEPVGRRIGVDDPYTEAKAALLDTVAKNNGAKAVWSRHLGFSTVFGYPDELDVIEELFTSLLVQAMAALRREGSKVGPTGKSRTTRFRRSFLIAYAVRIGQRLRETVEATVQEAQVETGTALVPVLAARDAAARSAAAVAFPEVTFTSPSVTDREGWVAGTVFGDTADLSVGSKLAERSA